MSTYKGLNFTALPGPKSSRKSNPPFRAEHVGSFLRPKEVLDARQRVANGELTAERLREIENGHIEELARKEQGIGIRSVTDGEFRRAYFHIDFLEHLEGIQIVGSIQSIENEYNMTPPSIAVTGKLSHPHDIEVANYLYLKDFITSPNSVVKITIPSPTMVHFRGSRQTIDATAYPNLDDFFADLAACYRAEIDSLYKAGCRYIQMDDTNLAYLCDPDMRAAAQERHGDINALSRQYAKLINSCIDGRPDDLCIGIHLCRGNYRSRWFAQGGYEPIAEVLFRELNVDVYFLEWESERAGDFRPLRFLPRGKTVVLGLVSSKLSELEKKEDIIKRIREAATYAPLEQLALSPQCGFSSSLEGNEITPETQWEKMKLVVEIAEEVWADA